MADETDHTLIHAYAETRCERSFAELVRRYIDLVYSTALRIVQKPALAEEVTQGVFLALAKNSVQLQGRSSLTGWLYETTRNLAINTVRSEERRRKREWESVTMQQLDSKDSEAPWHQIAPFLDQALARLSSTERELILWRYFERHTAAQIGGRLGVTAEAAQKRVSRALDRLRTIFAEQGLTTSASGMAAVLTAQAVQAAPAGLVASVTAAASVASVALTSTSILNLIVASTKAKMALAIVLAASLTTPMVLQHQKNSDLVNELTTWRQRGAELDHFRGEVERLNAEAQATARERDKERAELARLRGQVATLTAARPKANTSPLPPKRSDLSNQPERTNPADEKVARADWRNVGFEAPASTVQTLEWAKIHGDTNAVADGLAWADDESRSQIDALFAAAPEAVKSRYGSADAYILSLFNTSGPADDRHTLNSYRIVEENITPEEARLTIEYNYADGNSYTLPRRYVRIGNDWRQTLEFDAPSQAKLSAGLQSEAPSRATGLSGK